MLKRSFGEMFRFGIVGLLNTAVDFGIFFFFVWIGMPRVVAQIAGYTMGTMNSFVWNKQFTFRDQEKTDIGKVIRFLGVNVFSLGVSAVAIYTLPFLGVSLGPAKMMVTFLTLCINFFGYRILVFRKK